MNLRTIFFILIMLCLPLLSRENPFFPINNSTPNYSTNQANKPKPFRSVSIKLPDTVRILKSVTLTCENLDGSISTKKVIINRAVDWHDKIIISEEKRGVNTQIYQTKKPTPKHFTKIGSLRFIAFYTFNRELKIITKDKLFRKFKLVKPDRIVLDFKRDAHFRTFTFRSKGIFRKISIGNHKGYYRVVVELDGRYIYHILSNKEGYLLTLE